MMRTLHRHQLAYASPAAWAGILAADWDDVAREGLSHWAAHRLPLVVTRQGPPGPPHDAHLNVGLSLPERWQRRRLALPLPWSGVQRLAEFPDLAEVLAVVQEALPLAALTALRELADRLGARHLVARVYGSLGWQCVSGLRYLHPGSDIDLWIAVSYVDEADAAAELLASGEPSALRIDGELVFGNGCASPWREWRDWRAGRCSGLLVKRLDGVALLRRVEDIAPPACLLACAEPASAP